jgi:hypothetical protein
VGSTLQANAASATASGPGRDARIVASASCCSCGRPIVDWRERLLPIRSGQLVGTETGDLAVQVEHKAGCMHCGEERAEIRVEETGRHAMRGQFEEE